MDRNPDKSYKYTEIAGVLAACSSRCLTQPLDVLKVRLQLQVEPIKSEQCSKYQSLLHSVKTIFKEEGIKAFWKAHIPSQSSAVLHGFIQFGGYSRLSKMLQPYDFFESHPKFKNFFCGFISGSIALTFVTPIDIVKTRLIAQDPGRGYDNLIHGMKSIIKQDGIRGLYKGYLPSFLENAPMVGGQFMFYNIYGDLMKMVIGQTEGHLPGYLLFVSGGLAGITMKMIVYPIDLVKKRLQIQGFSENRQSFGRHFTCSDIMTCLRGTIEREGIRGCYKGMSPAVLKSSITVATYFTFYDTFFDTFK